MIKLVTAADLVPARGLRAWWIRKTVHRPEPVGCFFQRSVIQLGYLDRVLVLFGRRIVVETLTEHNAPSDQLEPFGAMHTTSWTEPRKWR